MIRPKLEGEVLSPGMVITETPRTVAIRLDNYITRYLIDYNLNAFP